MMQAFASVLPLPRLLSTAPQICRYDKNGWVRRFYQGNGENGPPPSSLSSCSHGYNEDGQNSSPPSPSSPSPSRSSSEARFELLSQDVIFKRYQTVYKREVRYPDGREISFDVLGNEKSAFQSVFIFPFDRKSQTVRLIREYSPGRNAEQLSLVAGMYEPLKHKSLEQAARAELSEEARLKGGELIQLSPQSGLAADKYSLNTFFFFLALDCINDPHPAPRDEEEWIHIEPNYSLGGVRECISKGLLNVPHSVCALIALEKLRGMGYEYE